MFKDVPGYEGRYQISDDGVVRSLISNINLRPGRDGDGYLHVCLWLKTKNGSIPRYYKVHRLVMEAFVGPRPKGHDVCHWDGDKENNKLRNLRYDTRRNNHADKIRHGTMNFGVRNGQAKLTEDEALEIIRLLKESDLSQREIAKQFGVSQGTITNINTGKVWNRVR